MSSDISTDISHLQAKIRFVALLSCNVDPDIIVTKSHKIVVLDDLTPDILKLDISVDVDEHVFSKLTQSAYKTNLTNPKHHNFNNKHR